jgi:hypothetical protein
MAIIFPGESLHSGMAACSDARTTIPIGKEDCSGGLRALHRSATAQGRNNSWKEDWLVDYSSGRCNPASWISASSLAVWAQAGQREVRIREPQAHIGGAPGAARVE